MQKFVRMKFGAFFHENLKISVNSIRSTKLRTSITILIIALGIMALVGILTAIESIKTRISSEFSDMGANGFTISSGGLSVTINGTGYRTKNHAYISQREAVKFKQMYDFPAEVGISVTASNGATVKYASNRTNPNITVLGVDEVYASLNGLELQSGRNFSAIDLSDGRSVCLLGHEVARKLFGATANPIDKVVSVGSGKYRVIGVMKSKGFAFGGGPDRSVLLPFTNVAIYFSRPKMNYTINVRPMTFAQPTVSQTVAQGEAEGVFRLVRRLRATDENDFNITSSDNLAQLLIENLGFVTFAATLIGIITLVGAAVGLMNIMLVAVSERTREIGTRKAIGARAAAIKQQFLFEAVLICQLGGLLGVILGLLVGNVVSLASGSQFVIPWGWMLGGLAISFVVGLISGYLPAVKASKLDPIVALRYE